MNYEKKYDELMAKIEAVKKDPKIGLKDGDYYNGYVQKGIRSALDYLLQEESEDERIRKAISAAICGTTAETVLEANGVKLVDALAYLKKQKEPHYTKRNALFDKCVENCDPEVMKRVSDEVNEMLQKEQKPNVELIQKSWYLEGYHDGKYNNEPKWLIQTGKGGPWYEENPKYRTLKPVESISQLTVQGKGVYKICPRCKERMVRDDSKVYTSMPPQYGYKCPKCGEMEFDTVMYDSPEMKEQKSADQGVKGRRGRIGGTPEHIRKKAENFLSKMEPPYDADDICSAYETGAMESIKQEWSEEDECHLDAIIEDYQVLLKYYKDSRGRNFFPNASVGVLRSEEKDIAFLKSLRPRPHWKPSEEQMKHLERCFSHGHTSQLPNQHILESLYNDLQNYFNL